MKVALVTTAASVPSAVGELARGLAGHLRELCELDVRVPRGQTGEELCGSPLRAADELRGRDADRILYVLGNERAQAFMVPMIRRLGGTVALQSWGLFELASAAFPELEAGGLAGHLRALREGGLGALRAYRESRADLRAAAQRLHLNRSVVRFGDAFIVPDEETSRRILQDRNATTPIGVVPLEPAPDWSEVARRYLELLESFPSQRTNRKSLIREAVAAADRAREERAQE